MYRSHLLVIRIFNNHQYLHVSRIYLFEFQYIKNVFYITQYFEEEEEKLDIDVGNRFEYRLSEDFRYQRVAIYYAIMSEAVDYAFKAQLAKVFTMSPS